MFERHGQGNLRARHSYMPRRSAAPPRGPQPMTSLREGFISKDRSRDGPPPTGHPARSVPPPASLASPPMSGPAPVSVTVPVGVTSTRMRLASRSARRSRASSMASRTRSGCTGFVERTVIVSDTPRTPTRFCTARSASSRWVQVSTVPSSVTQPFDTVDWMRSCGTSASHSSARRTACAISVSVRTRSPGSFTLMSFATSSTPVTRCAAS